MKPEKICFSLCVDDFGVKYFSKEDAEHLIAALLEKFYIAVDWDGKNYCGLNIDWHYQEGYIDIFMPMYAPKVLKKYNHLTPAKPTICTTQMECSVLRK